MCHDNKNLNERLSESLLDCKDEKKALKDDLQTWIDALEELSEIEDAFKTNEKFDMCGKTILDVGTDAVKPLYSALKFKPRIIVGINEWFRSFVSDIELQSKIFTDTKIKLYTCSLFNKLTLNRIRDKEGIKKFDYVLVSKTLHHLRTGKCVAKKRDANHDCKRNETERETEKNCIYGFKTKEIFEILLKLGTRVIIYECFDPNDEDEDKVRGRGGYFTKEEWIETLRCLSDSYEVRFVRPEQFPLNKETYDRVEPILRKVDCICFYVEKLKTQKS